MLTAQLHKAQLLQLAGLTFRVEVKTQSAGLMEHLLPRPLCAAAVCWPATVQTAQTPQRAGGGHYQ